MKPASERFRASHIGVLLVLSLLLAGFTHPTALAQTTSTFTPTGKMTTTRIRHTATLLLNGDVLLTGGSNDRPASAELYNAMSGAFTRTGDMNTARFGSTATLLPDGRVLIAGGRIPERMVVGRPDGLFMISSSPTASAELYDSATGTFTPTGNMVTAKPCHAATLLDNGKVLITGGAEYDAPVGTPHWGNASAELYDPATGTFAVTGPYPSTNLTTGGDLVCPTATLLADSRVLITWNRTLAELYDPRTDTFSATGTMITHGDAEWPPYIYSGRDTQTLLTNGKVLVAGGAGDSAEVYDPSTGKFSAVGKMTRVREDHTATLLRDGTVLITGSQLFPGATASAELYDPATGTFSVTADMTSPRFFHTATLLMDGRVLMAGGYTSYPATPTSDSAELDVPSLLVPAPFVSGWQFDRTSVALGSPYSVSVSGFNLTSQTFFDVRFISPGSNESAVVLNWQKGLAATHDVPPGTVSGVWAINGVRAHEIETDHTGSFSPVSATIAVSP
jgi:hypothetical protein